MLEICLYHQITRVYYTVNSLGLTFKVINCKMYMNKSVFLFKYFQVNGSAF